MSNEKRKCIAVYTAKAEKFYQAEILKGIYKVAFEHDMNVAVFSSAIVSGTEENIQSEIQIFSLADYDKFCGVIYLPHTFDFTDMSEIVDKPLADAFKNKNFPAITVDSTVDGLPSVHSDESEGIRILTQHMVKVHGCKDIAFMTGYKGHLHAERRLETFLEYMKEQNLEVPESRVYYGDFWYEKGEDFVNQLINSKEGLPEAIICANEFMANSVYHSLYQKGYSVPNDVLISCFNGDPEEIPFMSSVWKKTEKLGIAACEYILRMINGEKIPPEEFYVKCDYPEHNSITCNCEKTYSYDLTVDYNKSVFGIDSYFSEYNTFNESLLTAPNMELMFWSIDWFTYFIKGFKGLYFVMCENWHDPIKSSVSEGKFSDRMEIYYSREEKGEGLEPQKYVGHNNFFDTKEIFPKLFSSDSEPSSYIIRSLHFFGKCFGYIVIDNGSTMKTLDSIFNFSLKDVVKAIEAQLRFNKSEYLYSTDVMTGIYNRNAFNFKPDELIRKYKEIDGDYRDLLIITYDLDGLKQINDKYGHVEGDNAIIRVANAIASTTVEGADDELNFRIGGDEFVKFVIGENLDHSIFQTINDLNKKLEGYNARSGKPYSIHASVGYSLTQLSEISNISDILISADRRMYANKLEYKSKHKLP